MTTATRDDRDHLRARRTPPRRATLFALVASLGALAVAAPAPAAETSWPISLGEAGLTLDLDLYLFTPASGWASASAAGITTTDLGGGEYVFGNLPTATSEQRYALYVARASEPDLTIARYWWGEAWGRSPIAPPRSIFPSAPLVFKLNDTAGEIALTVQSGLPASTADPSTTATFSLVSATSGAAEFTGRPARITATFEHVATGTYGATFVYDLEDGGPAAAGNFLGEFVLVLPDARRFALPADNRLAVRFNPALDGS